MAMTWSILLLLSLFINLYQCQITIIHKSWHDDFQYDEKSYGVAGITGWNIFRGNSARYSPNNPIVNGTNGIQFHGPWSKGDNNEWTALSRRFQCQNNANVLLTFKLGGCDTESADTASVCPLNTDITDVVCNDVEISNTMQIDLPIWNPMEVEYDTFIQNEPSNCQNVAEIPWHYREYKSYDMGNINKLTPFTITFWYRFSSPNDNAVTWDIEIECSFSTNEPTMDPTPEPTITPTEEPTDGPTLQPTLQPSIATDAPTNDPTDGPTADPTTVPTVDPTSLPTDRIAVGDGPTAQPTEDDTMQIVTPSPSLQPTADPMETVKFDGNTGNDDDNEQLYIIIIAAMSGCVVGMIGIGIICCIYFRKRQKRKELSTTSMVKTVEMKAHHLEKVNSVNSEIDSDFDQEQQKSDDVISSAATPMAVDDNMDNTLFLEGRKLNDSTSNRSSSEDEDMYNDDNIMTTPQSDNDNAGNNQSSEDEDMYNNDNIMTKRNQSLIPEMKTKGNEEYERNSKKDSLIMLTTTTKTPTSY